MAHRLHQGRPGTGKEGPMTRDAREFLQGFERAAMLTRGLLEHPPAITSREAYVQDVADLNRDANDMVRRGLAVGCLVAVGRA